MGSAGTAWLLVISLVPEVGWTAFLLLSGYKLPKARRAIQDQITQNIDAQIVAINHSHVSIDVIIHLVTAGIPRFAAAI